MIFEFSAGFVVFYFESEPLYLLLHYGSKEKPAHWDFPKGKIEKGEHAIDAATRELKEETGIEDFEVIDGFKEKITYFFVRHTPYGKKDKIKKTVTFFLCKVREKFVRLSWEHIGYEWLPYDDALKKITFESSRKILQKAHNFLINELR
ncbi:MAG: bis(5'-nucleosyl)-tetraphosphatase [bacterium]